MMRCTFLPTTIQALLAETFSAQHCNILRYYEQVPTFCFDLQSVSCLQSVTNCKLCTKKTSHVSISRNHRINVGNLRDRLTSWAAKQKQKRWKFNRAIKAFIPRLDFFFYRAICRTHKCLVFYLEAWQSWMLSRTNPSIQRIHRGDTIGLKRSSSISLKYVI